MVTKGAILVAALALVWAFPAAAAGIKYGAMSYPADGNISAEEGTLELWLCLETDHAAPAVPPRGWYSFYAFALIGRDSSFALFWRPRVGLQSIAKTRGVPLHQMPSAEYLNIGRQLEWNAGDWRHLAFTWKGREMALYLDGQLMDWQVASAPLAIEPEARIQIGHHQSAVVVDGVRISAVARSEDEIKSAAASRPALDAYTLLLDRCEELHDTPVPGVKETRAETISGFSGEKGGSLTARLIKGDGAAPEGDAFELTAGKFGQGLRLKVMGRDHRQ